MYQRADYIYMIHPFLDIHSPLSSSQPHALYDRIVVINSDSLDMERTLCINASAWGLAHEDYR